MQTTKLFKGKKVRAVWDKTHKRWLISVVDMCAAICGCTYETGRNYWKQLKYRLLAKDSPLTRTVFQAKMVAKDGKLRYTDVMDYKKVIQLIQLLPCVAAKAFRAWLGQVAALYCNLTDRLDKVVHCTAKGVNMLKIIRTKPIPI